MAVRVRVLGPVQIQVGDVTVGVGPPQRCVVFAALAADAGRPVSREVLIDRVWGQPPPRRAWRTVQTHVASIRGQFVRAGAAEGAVVVRRAGGYLMDLDPDLVDVHRFRRSVARAARDRPGPGEGTALWRAALGVWRGEPLAGLSGDWVERTRHAWYDEYRDAVLGWAEAELRAGEPTAVIPALTELIGRYPLVEALPAMLMRALYAAGRRTEALACYAAARQRLDEELAERPGPELRAVHQAVLRREPHLPPPPGVLPAGVAVPAQLPADVRGFAGRAGPLSALDAIAATVGEEPTAVVISAIAGTAGVGKTALAVHWAHRAARRFPDGQLYVNLRGFDPGGTVLDPPNAIRGFLDALGLPPERIPADPDAQAALYRTLLADKRMLVVLDNARDTAQVRPLLPGAPGCLVLVTSRNRLTSLVAATGAHPLPLDLLTSDEARDLLARRLGRARVAAEPDAVDALVTQCARLPLALAIVAARAATHPPASLSTLAAELVDTRLDALADTDPATDIRAVFSWSYATLTAPAARLFRLLGLHPGPDLSAAAAASLAGLARGEVQPLLRELVSAHLIVEHIPGRFTLHDLLRAYAAELAHGANPAVENDAATRRLMTHYLHTAYAANRLLYPTRVAITPVPAQPGATPERPAIYDQALAWFTAEYPVLLAVVNHASTAGLDEHTWQLAWTLADYLHLRGSRHDLVAIDRVAVAAAERLADPAAQALTHRLLGRTYTQVGRYADAHAHLRRALDLYEQADDRVGQGHAHYARALLMERQGDYADSLRHLHRALHLFTATGDGPGLARALSTAGRLHAHTGSHQAALSYCQQALDLHRRQENPDGQAETWRSIGYVHHRLGHHTQAIRCYRIAIDLYRDRADLCGEAGTLSRLGDTHHASGDTEAARAAWRRALTLRDALHHPDADDLRTKLRQQDRPDP